MKEFDQPAYDVMSEDFKKASVYIALGKQESDGPRKDAILNELTVLISLNKISGDELGDGETERLFDKTEQHPSILKLLEDAGKCYGTLDEAFISQVTEELDKEVSKQLTEKQEKARLDVEKAQESKQQAEAYEQKVLDEQKALQETIRIDKLSLSELAAEYKNNGLEFGVDHILQYSRKKRVAPDDPIRDRLDFKLEMYELNKSAKVDGVSELDNKLFKSTTKKDDISIEDEINNMIKAEMGVNVHKALETRTSQQKGADIAKNVLLKCDFKMLDELSQSKAFEKGATLKEKFANAIHSVAPNLFKDTAAKYEAKKEVKSWVQKAQEQKSEQGKDKAR